MKWVTKFQFVSVDALEHVYHQASKALASLCNIFLVNIISYAVLISFFVKTCCDVLVHANLLIPRLLVCFFKDWCYWLLDCSIILSTFRHFPESLKHFNHWTNLLMSLSTFNCLENGIAVASKVKEPWIDDANFKPLIIQILAIWASFWLPWHRGLVCWNIWQR